VIRRFYIRTFGCQMNEHDSQRLAGLFAAEGMTPALSPEEADVVVLNTCCVRENADNKLYGHLGQLKALKRERPGLQIAVGGCLAQKDRELIQARAGHVDVVFGTHNLARAADLLDRARLEGPVMEILEESDAFPSALPARRDVGHAAWVTIQIGCDNTCAFCIVPAVRGKEISRRMGDVVREVEELAAAGVSEVTLLGQNVNSYGRDLGAGQYRPRFADLLRALDALPGIRRVRFTSPHPKDLRPETIAAMAECSAVCEHLHLPLQAGSDRTLARMHRGYTARRYLERLAAARAAVPDLAVTTDLIVGFPGETDDDFQATLDVVEEAEYDAAYTFVFSSRPGTEAAAWTDQFIPGEVSAQRMTRLTEAVERSALAHHSARVGRVEEVLVEGPSKKDASITTGRTRQNKLVHFAGEGRAPGAYVEVRVESAAPHYLRGTVVSPAGDGARRIPLAVTTR
jgi:tRNA-2-methylthio-N6-dimethylallyladenosine synthase